MFQQMMESRQDPAQSEVAYGRYMGRENNGFMSPQPNYNRNIENFSTLNAMSGLNPNFLGASNALGSSKAREPINLEPNQVVKRGRKKSNTFKLANNQLRPDKPIFNALQKLEKKQSAIPSINIFKKQNVRNLKAKVSNMLGDRLMFRGNKQPKYDAFYEELVPDSSKLLLSIEADSELEDILKSNQEDNFNMVTKSGYAK